MLSRWKKDVNKPNTGCKAAEPRWSSVGNASATWIAKHKSNQSKRYDSMIF